MNVQFNSIHKNNFNLPKLNTQNLKRNLSLQADSVSFSGVHVAAKSLDKQFGLSRLLGVFQEIKGKKIDKIKLEFYKGLAKALNLEAMAVLPVLKRQMEECFPKCRVEVRAKTAKSILEKFLNPNEKYTKLRQDLKGMDSARNMIGDALGVRLIFKKGQTPQDMAQGLKTAIEKGYIKLEDIEVYQSQSAGEKLQYLGMEELQKITQAQVSDDFVLIKETSIVKSDTKPSGYIGLNVNALFGKMVEGLQSTPLKVEVQIRGALVDRFAEMEHLLYDLTAGKKSSIKLSCPSSQKLCDDFRATYKGLRQNQKTIYQEYLQQMYEYVCKVELGLLSKDELQPTLPYTIPEILTWKYVKQVYKLVKEGS